jgi:hypothetical protein
MIVLVKPKQSPSDMVDKIVLTRNRCIIFTLLYMHDQLDVIIFEVH